MHFCQI